MEFKPTKKQSKKTEKKSKKPVTETKSSKKNTVEPKAGTSSILLSEVTLLYYHSENILLT